MFMAGDSTTNLHTCLDMYKDQVKEMQGMSLRFVSFHNYTGHPLAQHHSGYTIKLFLTGDYEFLCKMYGLQVR